MKRSEINQYITEAAAFFANNLFALPPFAFWTPEDWQHVGNEAIELRTQHLGWDITDFNSGNFKARGLTLFHPPQRPLLSATERQALRRKNNVRPRPVN